MAKPKSYKFDLAVIMPVYNEEACIVEVINLWISMLSDLNINFKIVVLNDGSQDNTQDVLQSFAKHDQIEIINKANSGHGPTILQGYAIGVEIAEWVFQCDSDNEMKANHFGKLWNHRKDYDALFGARKNRNQSLGRKLISNCSRLITHLFFSNKIIDVNTPYRLMRSQFLEDIIFQIPRNTFAPNIIIAGTLAKSGLRIFETDIPHEDRTTGTVSIVKWKLWKCAALSLWQTITCRPDISKISTRNVNEL